MCRSTHEQDKAVLRTKIQQWRIKQPLELLHAASEKIMQQLLALPAVTTSSSWFIYVSQLREVQTSALIEHVLRSGGQVSVPVVADDATMLAQRIESLHELVPGRWGILSPVYDGSRVLEDVPTISIVPSVAVTREGRRLGRGGGYYDRFLAANRQTLAISLVFEAQIVDAIPDESHDQPVDWIVTESQAWPCQRENDV